MRLPEFVDYILPVCLSLLFYLFPGFHGIPTNCDVSRWERDLTDTRRIQLVIHRLNSATKLSIPGISRGNNNSPSVESVSGINSLYLTNYSSSLKWIILLSRLVISVC